MLPPKIEDLVQALTKKTNNGELFWSYDDDNSKVSLNGKDYTITIIYTFSEDEEVGYYSIIYFDRNKNKEYAFSTNQKYENYELVKMLYLAAESSDLEIDTDFNL